MSQDTDFPAADAFPSTRWSRLVTAPGADAHAAREAFETLARRYWRPILAYVRARWARSDDDARDATQEFFLWMLEGDFLARADPARGRFRGFVKKSLANFLHDLERKRRTVKRGGGRVLLSLDDDESGGDSSAALDPADVAGRSPEELLDELWRRELLAQAADALEAELAARGKQTTFAVFRDYFLAEDELDYETVAQRYSITPVDVSNRLAYAKKRYRALLRAAVLETVGDDDDLRAELAWLFGGGA